MVGIEVAEDLGEVQDWRGVEAVAQGAEGSRRDVTVVDVDGGVVDGGSDTVDLEVSVIGGDVGDIRMSEADGVMHKYEDSAASTPGAVLSDDGEISEVRVLREGREFGLLEAGDDNVVGFKEFPKFNERGANTIAVELKDGAWLTTWTRRTRAGVWMIPGDEEKSDD